MDESQKQTATLATAGVLLTAAVVLGVTRWRSASATGEDGVRVYFYDQSEKRLYAAPRGTLPPDAGIGGESGDGVRAIVVARADATAAATQRIAYLETYTPALHEKLDAVQTSKKAGKGAGVKGPSGDDPFVLKNTLVRREGEAAWHDMTTPEARAIIREWTAWKDDAGRPLVVVTP